MWLHRRTYYLVASNLKKFLLHTSFYTLVFLRLLESIRQYVCLFFFFQFYNYTTVVAVARSSNGSTLLLREQITDCFYVLFPQTCLCLH